jgi:hypothetical protein
MLEKIDPVKSLNSLNQKESWAISASQTVAKWPRWIVHWFLNDTSTISHGRVRTWWTILIQCSNDGNGCAQSYDLQRSVTRWLRICDVLSQERYFLAQCCWGNQYLGFGTDHNMSWYKLFIPSTRTIMPSLCYPMRWNLLSGNSHIANSQ